MSRARTIMDALSRVDWPRALQVAATFARQLRGDDRGAIHDDHAMSLQRAEQITNTIERAARHAAGCSFTPGCKCPACALEPITRPTGAGKHSNAS